MAKLDLSSKQLKVLTWRDDVFGMDNKIEGEHLIIFYKADPNYWEQKISLEEAALIIHGQYDIEEQERNIN